MAAFGTSGMPRTPTAFPSTPGARRAFGYSPTTVPSTPGARHAVPTVKNAGSLLATTLAASPVVLAAPRTTLGTAAPSTLQPAVARTVGTTAVTRVLSSPSPLSSAPSSITSGAHCANSTRASIGTIPVPQSADAISTHTPSWHQIQAELNEKILRIVCYRAAAGAEAQLSGIMNEIEAHARSMPGLLDFRGGMEGPEYTAMMVFRSQAALDKYRKVQRDKFFAKLKPILEGPPEFDYQPPLVTHIVKQPPGIGHVMSIVGYKCADGKEAEWRILYDEIMSQIENEAVPGLVVALGAFLDSQAFMLGLVLESQSHLDSYKATAREQFLERMRPLLEDAPINELDNELSCPLRAEIA